jgi:nitrous oxidase accessory protein NosD
MIVLAIQMGVVFPAAAVDGVIEINQAQALAGGVTPDDKPGFPVHITESGSYRLTGNLTINQVSGIYIMASDVTLDLNGFTVFSSTCSSFTDGIFVGPDAVNAEIRNGTVRDFCRHGIFSLTSAPGVRVIGMRVLSNAANGLNLEGAGHLVQGCTVSDNGSAGVRALGESAIIGNNIRNNAGVAIIFGASCGYGMNTLTGNNGGNTNPQVSGPGVEIGLNLCGTNTVCP